MPFNPVIGMPGVGTVVTATPRQIFAGNSQFATYVPGGRTVSGTNSRDPGNVNSDGSTQYDVLRAGLVLGQITTGGKYAPAILGAATLALGGSQTTLTTSVGVATELNRRIGGSGTFNLTGPSVPGGLARTKTITYSAVNTTTGVVTITAASSGVVSAVNQIDSLVTVDSTGSGTFTITVEGITTAAITYNATVSTLITNINNALNSAFGTSAIVASGASLAALILTFSGTGYSGRVVGVTTTTPLAGSTGYTISGNGTIGTATAAPITTAGVAAAVADAGEFINGSFLQPTDGSGTPKTILGDEYGLKVTNQSAVSTDILADQLVLNGFINTVNIVNYPTDAGLITWLKSQLRGFCPAYAFSDDF